MRRGTEITKVLSPKNVMYIDDLIEEIWMNLGCSEQQLEFIRERMITYASAAMMDSQIRDELWQIARKRAEEEGRL